jgi:hypothetical protein
MRDAIAIFDHWIHYEYHRPSPDVVKAELKRHRALCASAANSHSYGKVEPSANKSGDSRTENQNLLRRARTNERVGRGKLLEAVLSAQRNSSTQLDNKRSLLHSSNIVGWSLVSFTALFGGPGLHGYGTHTISYIGGCTGEDKDPGENKGESKKTQEQEQQTDNPGNPRSTACLPICHTFVWTSTSLAALIYHQE